MKNKKGDMPVTILVLGVIAICGLALFSFYLPVSSFSNDFLDNLKVMEKINFYSRQIEFYGNDKVKENPEEVMEIFSREVKEGNFVFTGKVENGVYVLEGRIIKKSNFGIPGFSEEKEVFNVKYSLVP